MKVKIINNPETPALADSKFKPSTRKNGASDWSRTSDLGLMSPTL